MIIILKYMKRWLSPPKERVRRSRERGRKIKMSVAYKYLFFRRYPLSTASRPLSSPSCGLSRPHEPQCPHRGIAPSREKAIAP